MQWLAQIFVPVSIAVMGTVASVAGAFFTADATSNQRVNNVESNVKVLEERQANQYTEVKESLNRIETKLDKIAK